MIHDQAYYFFYAHCMWKYSDLIEKTKAEGKETEWLEFQLEHYTSLFNALNQ